MAYNNEWLRAFFGGCEYPYTDSQRYNDDWILAIVKRLVEEFNNFANLNKIKYADPISWDITRQYEGNTVVVDARTGNAYISSKPVPRGVQISDTYYWTEIYNYARVIDEFREQIATDDGDTTTAIRPHAVGSLVFVSGELYRVIAPMIAGDTFVVGSNVEHTTIEKELARFINALTDEAETRADEDTRLAGLIDDEADTRADEDTRLAGLIDDEADTRASEDTRLEGLISKVDIYELPIDHGAVGDGVADDTQAIQDTIDAAIQNGKTVFLNGKYKVTSITVDGAVKILGGSMPINQVTLTVSGSITFNYTQASSTIFNLNVQGLNTDDYLFKIYAQNLSIIGCTIRSEGGAILDYGALNKFTNNQIVSNNLFAFKFDVDTEHININCIVTNNIVGGSSGLLLVDSNDPTKRPEGLLFAENNSICSGDYCILLACAFHLTIINNTLDMIGKHALFFNPSQLIESVIFSDNYVGIISDEYFAIGSVNPVNEIWDLTISNNNVFGPSCLAYMPSLFRSVIIDGNNFSNDNLYNAGIYAHGVAYLRIINNRIQKTGVNATAFDCDGATGNHLIIANNIYNGLKTITNYDSNHIADTDNLIG